MFLFIGIVFGGIFVAKMMFGPEPPIPAGAAAPPAGAAGSSAVAPGQNVPEPPGGTPAGKVWSPEHGHYHDVQPSTGQSPIPVPAPGSAPVQTGTANTPQPPGPVPAGKVWSVEHGHWHDAPKP